MSLPILGHADPLKMPSDAFPLTEAQVIGLFVECICYGIYLVTLANCLKMLICIPNVNRLSLKRRREIKWPMLVAACLMFIFTTFDVAFGLQHNLQAFVFYNGPGGAAEEFSQVTNWVTIMKSVDYDVLTAIGDGILIYRFYIVYGSRLKLVIVPVILWLGCIATSAGSLWAESSTKSNGTLSQAQIQAWVYGIFALSLTLNAGLSSLIVWRLWKARSRVAHIAVMGPDRLLRVVRIVVDSALLYTLSVFVLIAVNIAGSNALYPVSDMIAQLIGITFNLIIIRSHHTAETEDSETRVMRDSYRLPHIDSTAVDSAVFSGERTDQAHLTNSEVLYMSSAKESLKSGVWTEQVLPVQEV